MINKLARIIVISTAQLSLVVMLFFAAPTPVHAGLFTESVKEACGGAQLGNPADCVDGTSNLEGIIKVGLNLLSIVAGVAAVIMFIIAGLRYITSSGDSAGVSGAKNTLVYAIVGLTIVALAQLIVKFVIDEVTTI